uniref:Uncharacterized protein n=1 Tax=Oryza meridionalis TaxID=40149 RepID=A0A0E0CZK4_9ORYZ
MQAPVRIAFADRYEAECPSREHTTCIEENLSINEDRRSNLQQAQANPSQISCGCRLPGETT